MVSLQQQVKKLQKERDELAAKLNKRQKTRLKKVYEPMTTEDYVAALATLDLSILAAADAFGVSPRQAQRYACGEQPISDLLAKLIRLAISKRMSGEDLKAI